MTTGVPYTPVPFTTSVVNPNVANLFRSVSYISPSEYRFAPTSLGTNAMVTGSTSQADSTESLAQVILRASSWINEHCFHRPDGSFAASPTTESRLVKIKPDGSLPLICNFKPVIEVLGIAGGASPTQLTSLDSTTALSVWIQGKTVWVPGGFSFPSQPSFPSLTPFATYGNSVFAVWTYIAGFPHATLASDVAEGDMTITLNPGVAGDSTIYGVYAGTPLTIRDASPNASNIETVIAAGPPNGLTVTLQSGCQYAHTVPAAPDSIMVTALPASIEQAAILMTSVLLKTRGVRSQIPGSVGAKPPSTQAMAMAGTLDDYHHAIRLLRPYVTTFVYS